MGSASPCALREPGPVLPGSRDGLPLSGARLFRSGLPDRGRPLWADDELTLIINPDAALSPTRWRSPPARPTRGSFGRLRHPRASGARAAGRALPDEWPRARTTCMGAYALPRHGAAPDRKDAPRVDRVGLAWAAGLVRPYFTAPVMTTRAALRQLTHPIPNTAKEASQCCQPFGARPTGGAGMNTPYAAKTSPSCCSGKGTAVSATELPHRLIGLLLVCAGFRRANARDHRQTSSAPARASLPSRTRDIEAARRKHNATVQVPAPQTGTSSPGSAWAHRSTRAPAASDAHAHRPEALARGYASQTDAMAAAQGPAARPCLRLREPSMPRPAPRS